MDPMTIAALGGGLIRGVSSFFGDSEEEKRNKQRKRLIEAIKAQQTGNKEMADKDKSRADMDASSNKSDRRNTLNQKLAQYGYDPVGSIASNEKDIILGNIQEKGDIEARLAEANALLQSQAGEINAGIEDEPDPFSTFIGESISGATEGINFGKALGFLDPARPGTGGQQKPNISSKYDTPVTNPEVNIAGLTLKDNTNQGIFDLGMGENKGSFNLGFDPNLSTGNDDYASSMMNVKDIDTSDLVGGKNPFKKFNNMYRLLNR